jgi:hypothetical protein
MQGLSDSAQINIRSFLFRYLNNGIQILLSNFFAGLYTIFPLTDIL